MLEVLSNAVDEVLAANVDALDDLALGEVVVALQSHIDRLSALQTRALQQWDARKVWSADGSRSAGHRYARETGLSIKDAKHLLHRARKLSAMPVVSQAFADGELSVSRIDLLVRTNQPHLSDTFTRDEELLVDAGKSLSFSDACQAMKYWQHRADADEAENRANKLTNSRRAHIAKTFEGTVDLQAVFEPVGGEIFANELQRLEDELFEQDWAEAKALHGNDVTVDKLPRTPAQRRCDALVLMATRSASATGSSNKPLLSVLIGNEALKNICELASGTVITPGQVLPLLSNAQIESIVFDGKSRIIDISHKRSFTGAVRRALEIRDRHCQHTSGCDVPANKCQGDHVMAWSKGGITDQLNGQLLCAKHNRVKGTGPP